MYNKIINGECVDVLQTLPDASVDCIVTSPPYWKGFGYEAYFNSYAQYLKWSDKWIKECKRVLKPDGTMWLNVINDSEITIRAFELMDICVDNMMKLHDTVIWYRYNQQPSNSDRQLTNQCEYLFMFRHTSNGVHLNKADVYEQCGDMFKTKNVGNVWEVPFNHGKKADKSFGRKETASKWGHSGFPILIPKACILLTTSIGDIILDPFIGTGTTAVAAVETDRQYIGIDMDKNACRLSTERLDSVRLSE
jgi:DNA modification methylase